LDFLQDCPCHRNNVAHTEQARTLSPSGTIRPGQADGLGTGLAVSPSAPAGPIVSRRDWHIDGAGFGYFFLSGGSWNIPYGYARIIA
jgi:hypothetical protein